MKMLIRPCICISGCKAHKRQHARGQCSVACIKGQNFLHNCPQPCLRTRPFALPVARQVFAAIIAVPDGHSLTPTTTMSTAHPRHLPLLDALNGPLEVLRLYCLPQPISIAQPKLDAEVDQQRAAGMRRLGNLRTRPWLLMRHQHSLALDLQPRQQISLQIPKHL
jgi:hypothetical protein